MQKTVKARIVASYARGSVGHTNGQIDHHEPAEQVEVYTENKLFATLDTTKSKVVRRIFPFLLSDTVGFIRKLPHHLVESFKSTLDEVRGSRTSRFHVVDISHPDFEAQMEVVNHLAELGCADKKTIVVFNKTDAYTWEEKGPDDLTPPTKRNVSYDELKKTWMAKMNDNCIFISAKNRDNYREFRDLAYKGKSAICTRYGISKDNSYLLT